MKILVVGVSGRALAASVVKSGYTAVTLDAFGDLDLQALCEGYSLRRDFGKAYSAAALYRASQKLEFDSVAYTANFENYPRLVAAFSRRAQIMGNPVEVLQRVRNWAELYGTLDAAGFHTPDTIFTLNGKQPDPARRWLRKPRRGGGGQHIEPWQTGQPVGRGMLLQEQLEGTVCSVLFVANGREAVVLGLTEQLVGRPEFGAYGFLYCGNVLPLATGNQETELLEQVRQIVSLLTREFRLVGMNGLDFMLAGGDIYPLEVNPRYTAAMELVECAYDLPIFELHMQAVTQGELPTFDLAKHLPASSYFAKTIYYAEKDSRAPDTHNWVNRERRDVPHPDEELKRGKPVCTILASADTRADCISNLIDNVEALKGEIYD